MASLVRPFTVSYQDKQGRRVPKGTPGAKKVKKRASKWYGQYKDPQKGKYVRVPLFTDKEASRVKLAEIVKSLARGEVGLVDPYAGTKNLEAEKAKQDWLADLRQKGRDEGYIYQQGRLLAKVFKHCDVKAVGHLTAEKLDAFLKGLTCSARTKNTYRQACFGLMNFLAGKGRLPDNPLRKVTRAEGEQKRKRRALPSEELQRLLDAARQRPLHEAMTIRRGPRKGQMGAKVKPAEKARLELIGRHRALLYLTALSTGLRRGELAELRVNDLHLDAKTPCWELDGARTKNKQGARMPLQDSLAGELRAWVQETGRRGGNTVFDIPPYSQTNKLFKKDLKKAGIPYRDESGRYFDFHALRKCTGSFLRQAKIDPSVSKLFMRHSDIRLTMEIYNDEMLLDLKEAVEAMPRLRLN
jgi:integrase